MLKFNIYITFSKLMAIIVLIIGSIFSFYFHEPDVMIFTLSLSGGLTGLKSWSEGLTRRKELQKDITMTENTKSGLIPDSKNNPEIG